MYPSNECTWENNLADVIDVVNGQHKTYTLIESDLKNGNFHAYPYQTLEEDWGVVAI